MDNTNSPTATNSPIANPPDHWWARLVSYTKRKRDERKADKEKESPTDRVARITATATVWIAVFTVVLAVVGGITLFEVVEGGTDTHDLAEAAKTQANRMKNMSDAADKIRQAAENMVVQDQRIADNSKAAIDASNTQSRAALDASIAASRNDQRAWISAINISFNAPEVGKTIEGGVIWRNSGKTFARKVTPNCNFVFVQNLVDNEAALEKMRGTLEHPASVGLLAPNSEYKTNLKSRAPADETDKTRITGNWFTYVWGEIVYEDVYKSSHTTKFCSWRQGSTGDFLQCPFHNEAE